MGKERKKERRKKLINHFAECTFHNAKRKGEKGKRCRNIANDERRK